MWNDASCWNAGGARDRARLCRDGGCFQRTAAQATSLAAVRPLCRRPGPTGPPPGAPPRAPQQQGEKVRVCWGLGLGLRQGRRRLAGLTRRAGWRRARAAGPCTGRPARPTPAARAWAAASSTAACCKPRALELGAVVGRQERRGNVCAQHQQSRRPRSRGAGQGLGRHGRAHGRVNAGPGAGEEGHEEMI